MHKLYYFHDPMCSWCWGYRPVADKLFAALPKDILLQKVVGGLAPDSDEPMSAEMKDKISNTWRRIHDRLDTEFNYDFWDQCEPRRSTYPACRAVIAAAEQDGADDMLNAIQRAYYLSARNPSDVEMLVAVAGEIGLDKQQFADDIESAAVEKTFQRHLRFTRLAGVRGFPAMMIKLNDTMHNVAKDYSSHLVSLEHIRWLISR
jgi:putative protein-disulfide isomerase